MLVLPLKGVHPVGGGRQADCWHSRKTRPGVGPEEHGLRSAKEGIQSQVSDALHQSLPQQTGVNSNKRCGLQVEVDLVRDSQ